MHNSGICDTKLAICLKRSSLEPNLLQSVYKNWCAAYRLVTNLVTYRELWPNFLGSKIFSQQIFCILFCRSATKFDTIIGDWAIKTLIQESRDTMQRNASVSLSLTHL